MFTKKIFKMHKEGFNNLNSYDFLNFINNPPLWYLILIIVVLFTLTIIYAYLKQTIRKKQNLPLIYIHNILNGKTKNFFIQNKIKITNEFFDKMELLVKNYENTITYTKEWRERFRPTGLFVIIFFFAMIPMILNLTVTHDFYTIKLLIFFPSTFTYISLSFIIAKYHTNPLIIGSQNIQSIINEWKEQNKNFNESRNIINLFNMMKIDLEQHKKLIYKDNNNKSIRFETNWKTYNKFIFENPEEWSYFKLLLPWNSIYKDKTNQKPFWIIKGEDSAGKIC